MSVCYFLNVAILVTFIKQYKIRVSSMCNFTRLCHLSSHRPPVRNITRQSDFCFGYDWLTIIIKPTLFTFRKYVLKINLSIAKACLQRTKFKALRIPISSTCIKCNLTAAKCFDHLLFRYSQVSRSNVLPVNMIPPYLNV